MGRLGGEEFGIFLTGARPEDVASLGERLCRPVAMDETDVDPGSAFHLTLSIGAVLDEAGTPPQRLLARADAALYRAKYEGRARMRVWTGDENRAA